MSFLQAADSFLQSRTAPVFNGRSKYVSERTLRDYHYYLKTLAVFFGELKLQDIHLGHFAEYERCRSVGEGFTRVVGNRKGGEVIPSCAGPNKIRAELSLLSRILRKAGLWSDGMKENYLPLQQVESDAPRALSPDEQERFLAAAGSNPEWYPLFWYSLVAFHLTFSSDEMRTIRIGDINLNPEVMLISVNRRYGKNKFRRRTVTLCDAECAWALGRLIERARELGGGKLHHFLFPFRVCKGQYDHEKPMGETGLRKQFDAVRQAAKLDWFRFNGHRHTAITRLAEAGVPIAVIMQRSGHVTAKMSEHYTHISQQAERYLVTRAASRHGKPVVSIAGSPLEYRQLA